MFTCYYQCLIQLNFVLFILRWLTFDVSDNIKAADSVQNFKKQLKTLLFRKEFN